MRETVADFRALDTEPYGVNEGDVASHQRFSDRLGLPFALLVDEGLQVARAYGALKPEGNRINRTVVIVGKNGRVIVRAVGAPPPGELLTAIRGAADDPA